MHGVLESGTTVDEILSAIASARASTDMGFIAMVSESIVHKRGSGAFLRTLAEAGIDGVIIPDLDPALAAPLLEVADDLNLSFSLLVSPTTPIDRLQLLVENSRGFVYLLARAGITGATNDLPDLHERVAAIRAVTDLPIAAGFGIGTPEQVAAVTTACDAAIVGSALVGTIDAATDPVGQPFHSFSRWHRAFPSLFQEATDSRSGGFEPATMSNSTYGAQSPRRHRSASRHGR